MPTDRTNANAFKLNIDEVSIRGLGDALAAAARVSSSGSGAGAAQGGGVAAGGVSARGVGAGGAAAGDREAAGFDARGFVQMAASGLGPLELKARVGHVADALEVFLPDDFVDAAAIVDSMVDALDDAAGSEGTSEPDDGTVLGMWELWPLTEWVSRAGRAHPEVALELLARLTRYSTGEFAVRPFIDDDVEAVLERFARWVGSGDEHVRRLVSEGTRPRLPWAGRMAVAEDDPGYARALLDVLVEDESEYVRRSVSNHLNDYPKMDRALALAVAEEWTVRADAAESVGDDVTAERIRWVVRRGIRTLVKAGDPDAMRLLGHDPDAAIDVVSFVVHTPTVTLGSALELGLELRSADVATHTLVLDYAIHFLRANGTAGRKVFKWSTFELAAGVSRTLERSHPVKPITTRTYRPGRHVVDVQINGVVVATGEFELLMP